MVGKMLENTGSLKIYLTDLVKDENKTVNIGKWEVKEPQNKSRAFKTFEGSDQIDCNRL